MAKQKPMFSLLTCLEVDVVGCHGCEWFIWWHAFKHESRVDELVDDARISKPFANLRDKTLFKHVKTNEQHETTN